MISLVLVLFDVQRHPSIYQHAVSITIRRCEICHVSEHHYTGLVNTGRRGGHDYVIYSDNQCRLQTDLRDSLLLSLWPGQPPRSDPQHYAGIIASFTSWPNYCHGLVLLSARLGLTCFISV